MIRDLETVKTCKNCKGWKIESDDWGICEYIQISPWFDVVKEIKWEYGPHGDYPVEPEIEIKTEARFYCPFFENRETNQR